MAVLISLRSRYARHMATSRTTIADPASAWLLLGRLDGRLCDSPWADIWMARARLRGAAALCSLAGVPVTVAQLQDWICGRTPPPRASEGLNDPLSVAAIFHLAIEADTSSGDSLACATRNILRDILDDRTEAATWASDDLAHYGPAWRAARAAASAPFTAATLEAVTARILAMLEAVDTAGQPALAVTGIDGRTLTLDPPVRDRAWLVATHVGMMFQRCGLTTNLLASLTLLPRLPPRDPETLMAAMTRTLRETCHMGLRDLDWLERHGPAALPKNTTRRSKAPLLARLALAYPGLRAPVVARMLGVTPQGARKLLAHRPPLPSSSNQNTLSKVG